MKQLPLSITQKIFFGFFGLLLLFAAVDGWGIFQLHLFGDRLRTLEKSHISRVIQASKLEAFFQGKKADLSNFFSATPGSWDQEQLKRLQVGRVYIRDLKELLPNANGRRLTSSKSSHTHSKQLAKVYKLLLLYQKTLQKMLKSLEDPDSSQDFKNKDFRNKYLDLRRSLRKFIALEKAKLTQNIYQLNIDRRNSIRALLALALVGIFVGTLVTFLIRIPLRRIDHLVDMTERIGEGDYQLRVDIPSGDEIGFLAQSFNQMAESLQERDKHLARQREALEEAYQDLQKSSERLLRSERLATIGHLAAQITHEVRNPLNAIGLNLELLEEDLEALSVPHEARSLVQATTEEVERLTQITEEYLRFARLPPPQLEPTNINHLLNDLMAFLGTELVTQNIEWDLQCAPELQEVNIDQRQLRQALINLIRNAMEAARSVGDKTGELFIETRAETEVIQIHIQDNGPGIPKEKEDKIFDPFFSTKEEGSGLGLPLTQQIIVGHGGEIVCESEEGKGTRFIISLPHAT